MSKPTSLNPPLGLLNNIGTATGKPRITAEESAASIARMTQKQALSHQVFKNISKFKAIVLRVKRGASGPGLYNNSEKLDSTVSRHAPASWGDRLFGISSPLELDEDVQLIQIWARIPELHAGLEPPEGLLGEATDRDNWLIDQHDIFTAQDTDVPEPKPGDIVWVDYGNRNNFTDPIYLGPVLGGKAQITVSNKSSNTLTSIHSSGGKGCVGSQLNGASPKGDSLAGSNTPATTTMDKFTQYGTCYPTRKKGGGNNCKGKNSKGQYIWWLYTHEAKHLPAIRQYWLKGGNRARLKAYVIWAADYWIKKAGAKNEVVDIGPLLGWEKGLEPWRLLAQIVWGVFYRECRWNPLGTLGGTLRNSPSRAIELNDTGYGMGQPPKAIRFDWEKTTDKKNLLGKMEHWELLDPKLSIDFTIISYLRLFRNRKKTYKKDGLLSHMKKGGKNTFSLGIWWAGGGAEHKYTRKHNDIKVRGPTLWNNLSGEATVKSAIKSLLGSETIKQVIDKRPVPAFPPNGGEGRSAEEAFGVWRAIAEKKGVNPATDTSPASSKSKKKAGSKSQLPSTDSPPPTSNCHEEDESTPQDHPQGKRKKKRNLSPLKLEIADIPSKWKKGAKFRDYKRRGGLDQIVLHESLSSGRKSTERILTKRNLGVHFIIDRHGGITQHVPIERACSHAKGNNHRSVGIEIENPFFGKKLSKTSAKSEVIPVQWLWRTKSRGGYLTNTSAQLNSLYKVISWVCKKAPTIKKTVPGQKGSSFYWGSAGGKFSSMSGIIPHNWGKHPHGDGLMAAHYMFLRLNKGMSHSAAYKRTITVLRAVASGKKPRWTDINTTMKA